VGLPEAFSDSACRFRGTRLCPIELDLSSDLTPVLDFLCWVDLVVPLLVLAFGPNFYKNARVDYWAWSSERSAA